MEVLAAAALVLVRLQGEPAFQAKEMLVVRAVIMDMEIMAGVAAAKALLVEITQHLEAATAGMVKEAAEYRWSSAAAHAGERAYPDFLDRDEFASLYSEGEWREILRAEEDKALVEELRYATRVGRVAGGAEFIKQLEAQSGRRLTPKPSGRPRKVNAGA